MRQIVLDTETTGLEPEQGHRIIEIGCVEMINRRLTGRTFHHYLNPERDIDPGAQEVHGLSREFLSDKPLFGDVADEFLEFVGDAELVIHNAPFDVGFLDAELTRLERDLPAMQVLCPVLDTLVLAREMHPGQRNSLDALCRRYQVDNSQRELHGALLDARILAEVYLAMTGGQAALSLGTERKSSAAGQPVDRRIDRKGLKLVVVRATDEELAAHEAALDRIEATGKGEPVWRNLER
ncbi:MAG: DNA polymerase III subunit epsilon [Gammaproteobacteria bacterium]|jgi:DNA polymerase-3 subunit epsilon|nr:MAG: DNA polymerase III subunit epsilon [Gammaproteobacteria bacterium SG8_31]